jgi:chromosome segregation ATPase
MKEIIMELREVRKEKGLSYGDIMDLLEQNGYSVASSTLSRLFSESSTETNFSYENIIRPIANVLLDIEHTEEADDIDTKAYKSILKYKSKRIHELEEMLQTATAEIDKEKLKGLEKLEEERERSRRSIDFLKHQIEKKDERIDMLLQSMSEKDAQIKDYIVKLQQCPYNKEK